MGPISHAQRVCRLYKAAYRCLESHNSLPLSFFGPDLSRIEFRYKAVLLRARFDENKDITDYRQAKQLVEDGEREVYRNQHPQPLKFPTSPGGSAYDRVEYPPDYLLDHWHPLEKAAYPKYFALREIRKQEHIDRWQKKYGKQPSTDTDSA